MFLRARSYLPTIGRFIERGTVLGAQGVPRILNRYIFAADNPLNFTDPDGHRFFVPGPSSVP